MSKMHEFGLAGSDPLTAPGGDGLRRLTHGLLAVYLAPVVLLVLVVGGVMAVLVKVVELAARAVEAVVPVSAPPAGTPRGVLRPPGRRPQVVSAARVSDRTGSEPPRRAAPGA